MRRAVAASSAVALALALVAGPGRAEGPASGAHPGELSRDAALVGEARLPDVPEEYLVTEDGGFKVVYHPATRERVRAVLPLLAGMRADLSAALGVPVLQEVELRVAALPLELERLGPPREEGTWTPSGCAFLDRSLVIVAAQGVEGRELEPSIRHLFAHLALEQATNGAAMPVWFQEGFAVHFADADVAARAQHLEVATLKGEPPSTARLAKGRIDEQNGAYAADFVRFASSERAVVPSLVSGLRAGLPFDRALETAFGAEAASIDRSWREDIARRYAFLPTLGLGILLFLVVFVVGAIRRRRRSEAPTEAVVSPSRKRRARLRVEARDVPRAHPAELPEIPKVEHDGRWHTLH
jgi:hypothetical protein